MTEAPEQPAADDAFVDAGLLAWFASLTPDERLDWLQDFVDSALALRALNGIDAASDEVP